MKGVRYLSIFLCALMVLSCLPMAQAEEKLELKDGAVYQIIQTKENLSPPLLHKVQTDKS